MSGLSLRAPLETGDNHDVAPDFGESGHRPPLGNARQFVGARVKPGHDGKVLDLKHNRHART